MNAIHSNDVHRVVIVGAGIAGLTAATELARAGWETTVVERGAQLRTGGYKIDVRGAALGVLDRMGLAEAVRARHLGIRAGSVVTADGTTIAQLGGDTFGGREGRDIEVERGDLLQILADAAVAAGVTIRTDAVTESVGVGPDGRPVVTLAGGESIAADFVVGADGLHSVVRRAVVGDADVVRDMGYGVAVHDTSVDLGIDREEMTYVSAGRTTLVYDTGRHTRAMYLFARTGPVPGGVSAAEYVRSAYDGEGWRVPEILAALPDSEDIYLDSMCQVVAPIWSRDRVVVVGDAAWCASPASGQGTSLALVGGYVLAARLARDRHIPVVGRPRDDDDPSAAALGEYERAMRPFVEANQKLGPANVKRMVLGSDRAVRSTLKGLRFMNRLPFSDWLMRQAMRPLHRAANAIDLDRAAGGLAAG